MALKSHSWHSKVTHGTQKSLIALKSHSLHSKVTHCTQKSLMALKSHSLHSKVTHGTRKSLMALKSHSWHSKVTHCTRATQEERSQRLPLKLLSVRLTLLEFFIKFYQLGRLLSQFLGRLAELLSQFAAVFYLLCASNYVPDAESNSKNRH